MYHLDAFMASTDSESHDYYELTDETREVDGNTVYRIRATKYLPHLLVRQGELGGFVQSKDNLRGYSWVYHDAVVMEEAVVTGRSRLVDESMARGCARVDGGVSVYDRAVIGGETILNLPAPLFIGHDSYIMSDLDVLVVGPLGENAETLVLARQRDGKPPKVYQGGWSGTLNELMPQMRRLRELSRTRRSHHSPSDWDGYDTEYATALMLMRHRAHAWKEEGERNG